MFGNYGPTPYSEGNRHYALPGHEAEVHYGEELFVAGVRQRRVNSLEELAAAMSFFDYDNDRIYLPDDPAGALAETSVTELYLPDKGSQFAV